MNELTCPLCGRKFQPEAGSPAVRFCNVDGSLLTTPAGAQDNEVAAWMPASFELLAWIGRGSTSDVYKVKEKSSGATLVLKILRGQLMSDSHAVARFQRESRLLISLKHKNIAETYADGQVPDGRPYLVMEYLNGTTLGDVIKQLGAVPIEQLSNIFSQVIDALSYSHEREIFHWDLKPDDVMLVPESGNRELVKVLDFGKGKGLGHVGQPSGQSTDSGDLFGDPRYISPEVSRGDKLDQRSNIYSLGCILFEAATGSPMWTGNNWFAVIQRKMSESSPSIRSLRSDLPAALDLLIAKATDPQPEKRHQSIDEVARDFKAAGLPVANTALLTGSMS